MRGPIKEIKAGIMSAVLVSGLFFFREGKPAAAPPPPFESLVPVVTTDRRYNILAPGEEAEISSAFFAPEDLLDFRYIKIFTEEHQPNGDSRRKYAKDPAGSGQVAEFAYVIKNRLVDWIDCAWNPSPSLDWSNYRELRLEVYPLSGNSGNLTIKICDEKGLLCQRTLGNLKPGIWQEVSVPLNRERSHIYHINFFVPCGDANAPLNQELRFCLRNMRLAGPIEEIPSVKESLKNKEFVIKTEVVDFFGRKIMEDARPFAFRKGEQVSKIKVKIGDPGFYWINLSLSSGGKEIKGRASIGVIPPGPKPAADLSSPFGIFGADDAWLACIAGIKWNYVTFQWLMVEPTKGNFAWEKYDGIVDEFHRAGINILGNLMDPPRWASRIPRGFKPVTEGINAGLATFPPDDLEAWGKFVYETVNRYKDRVRVWEIWNEPWPDCRFFFGGTVQDYVDLLKTAYEQAKKADSGCLIVGIGTEENNMRLVFEAGGYPYMDIASIHPFPTGTSMPEVGGRPENIRKSQKHLKRFGREKQKDLWSTSAGWPTNITDMSIKDNCPGIPVDLQGKYLPRAFVLGMAAGLKKEFWYCFRNFGGNPRNFECNQGIVFDDLTPKPSFVAYAALTRMLAGLDYAGKADIGAGKYCLLFEKGNRSCFVLWAREGAALITAKLPDGVRMVDMMGAARRIEKKGGGSLSSIIPLSDCVTYLLSDRSRAARIKAALEKEKNE